MQQFAVMRFREGDKEKQQQWTELYTGELKKTWRKKRKAKRKNIGERNKGRRKGQQKQETGGKTNK